MKKTTLSLIIAGTLAAGGLAQAQTSYDTPASNSDTQILGAGPTTVMVPMEHYTYVQPGWNDSYRQRHQAAGTFNTPARAGEATTMTNGQPNASTDNQRIANDVHVPVWSVPN
jgi:hypothetical protein